MQAALVKSVQSLALNFYYLHAQPQAYNMGNNFHTPTHVLPIINLLTWEKQSITIFSNRNAQKYSILIGDRKIFLNTKLLITCHNNWYLIKVGTVQIFALFISVHFYRWLLWNEFHAKIWLRQYTLSIWDQVPLKYLWIFERS